MTVVKLEKKNSACIGKEKSIAQLEPISLFVI